MVPQQFRFVLQMCLDTLATSGMRKDLILNAVALSAILEVDEKLAGRPLAFEMRTNCSHDCQPYRSWSGPCDWQSQVT